MRIEDLLRGIIVSLRRGTPSRISVIGRGYAIVSGGSKVRLFGALLERAAAGRLTEMFLCLAGSVPRISGSGVCRGSDSGSG